MWDKGEEGFAMRVLMDCKREAGEGGGLGGQSGNACFSGADFSIANPAGVRSV